MLTILIITSCIYGWMQKMVMNPNKSWFSRSFPSASSSLSHAYDRASITTSQQINRKVVYNSFNYETWFSTSYSKQAGCSLLWSTAGTGNIPKSFFVLPHDALAIQTSRKELRCSWKSSGTWAWGPAKGPSLYKSEMAASLCRSMTQAMALWNLRAECFILFTEISGGWNLWHLFLALQRIFQQTLGKLRFYARYF